MTEQTDSAESSRPAVGSLAEEASQLFAVLSGLAREQAEHYGAGAENLTASAAAAAKNISDHVATGDAECTYCPICRVVHAARSASPEVKQHLASALVSLAQAASALMAPPSAASAKPDQPHDDGSLHKIDLDDHAWE